MRRGWAIGGAGTLVLVLVGWLLASREDAPRSDAGGFLAATHVPASGETKTAPSALIELFLLPDGPVRAVPGSVRIGLGTVTPDSAATAPAALEPGVPQAGAVRFDELSTPTQWVAAPAELLEDGRARVGPLRLPRVDRYTLQARGEDGLRYYMAAFTAEDVPASVMPLVGAGVRTHVDVDGTQVLLRRIASSAPVAAWQRLQAWAAPALLEAFNEQPLPVRSGQVLAPLPPGPVEIVLEVEGVEAERRRISLPAGRITDIHFDPVTQKVAQAVSIDLELEFVKQGTGEAVSGLQVSWLSGRTQQTRETDARGRAVFKGLDRQQVHEFSLAADAPPDGLPEWPELRALQIGPDDLDMAEARGNVQRHRVELVPLRWLVARVPPEASRTSTGRRSPYPIYVLQRQRAGHWVDAASDHFIPTPEGLAVSIAEPGVYRVAAALSPWRVLESTAARVDGSDRPSVGFPEARGIDVAMTVMRDGKKLAGVPVHIIGPVGNLPPTVLKADAAGRVVLPAANASQVRVEVPGSDQISVVLSGPTALADFGAQRSE